MRKEDVSAGVTAFLDILGFGNKVLDASSLSDLDETDSGVQLIRSAFDFESADELTRDVQKLHQTTISAFSDCVVVNVPLESEATQYEGTFDPIMSVLTNFAYGQGQCCQNSLFIRGGIDLGWWYNKESTVISQSLVRAYSEEGEVSVPVIALTDELYTYFSNHVHSENYSKDYDPVPAVFRTLQNDKGKIRYFDYITVCLESLGWQRSKKQIKRYKEGSSEERDNITSQGYRRNIDDWLIGHARNIESAHSSAKNDNVKAKYAWLCGYHNEVSAKYTSNTECECAVVSSKR